MSSVSRRMDGASASGRAARDGLALWGAMKTAGGGAAEVTEGSAGNGSGVGATGACATEGGCAGEACAGAGVCVTTALGLGRAGDAM